MKNKEVEMAGLNFKITCQIKEMTKSMTGIKKTCIDAALAICQIFTKPVSGTKNNPIKFSKRWKRK